VILAVFDATTLLQAAANRQGPAGQCLAFADEGHVQLLLSADTLAEIRDVLDRPKIRRSFPKLTDEHVDAFLDRLIAVARHLDDIPAAFRLDRDPDDEPYVNLAIAAGAGFLVSRDNDLLDLAKDTQFIAAHPSLAIVDPVAFLRHVQTEVAKKRGYE
jgi:uncharacterized protein